MQQEEFEARQHGSQFAPKMTEINPRFSMDRLKQQQADNVSIYELDQEALIEKVRHTLAGEIYDPETDMWVADPDLQPPMNHKGVHFFMLKFGGHLDKNVTLSNLTIERIHMMIYEIEVAILEIFFKRAQEFEIKQENMDYIKQIVAQQIYANLLRALDSGERKHRETLIKSVESVIDRQSNSETIGSNSGGLFGFLKANRPNRGGQQ